MSTYVRETVLRIPYERTGLQTKFADVEEARNHLEEAFPDLFDYGTEEKFQFAPTESVYIDYVVDYDSDAMGEYGKVRELLPVEKDVYHPIFAKIMPDADFSAIRVVEFCWYNCTEAPDYYNDIFNEPKI
jgi:hypothetical protein